MFPQIGISVKQQNKTFIYPREKTLMVLMVKGKARWPTGYERTQYCKHEQIQPWFTLHDVLVRFTKQVKQKSRKATYL